MVGTKTLKSYELNSITEYFDMCIESKINGNRSQAINQVQKLSKSQKLDFMRYLKETSSDYQDFFLTVITGNAR